MDQQIGRIENMARHRQDVSVRADDYPCAVGGEALITSRAEEFHELSVDLLHDAGEGLLPWRGRHGEQEDECGNAE